MTKSNRSITFFGSYPDNYLYSRNQEIRRAYKSLGYELEELGVVKTNQSITENRTILTLIFSLLKQLIRYLSLFRFLFKVRRSKAIYLPYPAHLSIFILKLCLIGKRPLVIMDAFLGLYNTVVEDRQLVSRLSFIATLIKRIEKSALSLPDRVLLDTEHQAEMLRAMYGIPNEKLVAIPVGINEDIWYPDEPSIDDGSTFKAMFWGTFIPLHGIDTIIEAAKILVNKQQSHITIELIGTGQTAPEIRAMLAEFWPENLHWNDSMIAHETLAEKARSADCVLGIFSDSDKADNVIPYKIYQALALNKPVITRESKSFGDEHRDYGIYTVKPESASQLADCLIQLSNKAMAEIQHSPREYYLNSISNQVIANKLNQMMGTTNHG